MVVFLEKSIGSAWFHQIIDFLNRSHICYALTKKPDVCVSFIKQFWRSAEVTTADNGEVKINATIYGPSRNITEASLRRHLKLDDQDGLSSITQTQIRQEVALFPTMLDVTEPSTLPSRITSSPSPSPEPSPSYSPEHSPTHSPSPAPSPTPEHITAAPIQPSPTQPSLEAEHHLFKQEE
ncbi:hypothetical protein Tco_1481290 [Tanacetum coccineum]